MQVDHLPTAELLRRIETLEHGQDDRRSKARLGVLRAELGERPVQDIVTAQAELAR